MSRNKTDCCNTTETQQNITQHNTKYNIAIQFITSTTHFYHTAETQHIMYNTQDNIKT